MADELSSHDIKTLTMLFAKKALSPRELLGHVFSRVERFEPMVNAFSLLDRERAFTAATASEIRWLKDKPLSALDGIPTTIKDIVWAKDWPTTYGSHVVSTEPSTEDAPCVARLKEAGAVLFGMTTTPELGWKGVTDSPRLGITRNPWDCNKTPGGSSGGAAVAAAMGMGSLHIGTDGGGSVRIPAGFTGIVGHKPSFGRVPTFPMSPFGTVSHIGPMARHVTDVATMLTVLAQPDSRDWYSLPADNQIYEYGLTSDITGLRIAYSKTLGYVDVDSEVADCVDDAVRNFEQLGAIVETVDPGFDNPQEIFHKLWFIGAYQRLQHITDKQKYQLDTGLIEIIEQGSRIKLGDYLEAVRLRAELGAVMCAFHQRYDLLLTPSLPIPAFDAGQETPNPETGGRWTDWAGFSYPFNLTQQPACSIPCGLTSSKLPVGLQIIGPMHADALVLRAAKAYEATRNWELPDKPLNYSSVSMASTDIKQKRIDAGGNR